MSIPFSLQIRDSYETNQSQSHHALMTIDIPSLTFTAFLSSCEPILKKGLFLACLKFLKHSSQYLKIVLKEVYRTLANNLLIFTLFTHIALFISNY